MLDILFMKRNIASQYTNNEVLMEIMKKYNYKLENKFPRYGYILNQRINKAMERNIMATNGIRTKQRSQINKLVDGFMDLQRRKTLGFSHLMKHKIEITGDMPIKYRVRRC